MTRSPIPFLALSSALALLPACDSEDAPELATFENCDQLDAWLTASARKEIDYVSPPGMYYADGAGGAERATLATNDAGGGMPPAEPQGATNFSSTNVQVDGVDEADFVKNDGRHIYMLDSSGLNIIAAGPIKHLTELSRTELEGQPSSLYFDGEDRVVVFSQIWNGQDVSPVSGGGLVVAEQEWDPVTKMTFLDVTDRAAPEVTRELYVQGTLRTSRRVANKVHVVLTDYLSDRYQVWSDNPFADWRAVQRNALGKLGARDWIPDFSDHRRSDDGWRVRSGNVARCTDVYKPVNRTELQFTSVLTLDLQDPEALDSIGVLARADTVYSTADTLYFAMAEWDYGPFRSIDGSVDSRLHKFNLADDGPVYTASGLIPGTLLNQFSMGEHDGFLRVATTDWNRDEVSSSVFVMGQEGTRLDAVGAVTDIAPGETIFSARFEGDRGYVVTFEQIDPLFTLDLADPTDPRILGELEVTGFSNYLHPLGDDHLLAVGEEVSADGFSWEGLQISLFDVSDFTDPLLADRAVVPGMGWSEAQYNHHAFTFYEPYGVLSIPVQRWNEGDDWPDSALALFDVDVDAPDPLVPLVEIDHGGWLYEVGGQELWEQAQWCNQVRRTIFMDDLVFVVSDFGIQATTLADPRASHSGWLATRNECNWGFWGAPMAL